MKFEIKIYHLWMRLFSCFILYIFILKNRYKTQDNAVFWFRRCKIFTQKILLWPRILKPSGYCFNQRVVWTTVVNFRLKTLLTSFVLFSFKPPLRNSYIILRYYIEIKINFHSLILKIKHSMIWAGLK